MKYKRFLLFAWDIGDETDNPLGKIRDSFDLISEANESIVKYGQYDFVSVFDCEERETIIEQDNIPF